MQWLRIPRTNGIESQRRQTLREKEFGVESWDTPLRDADYFVVDLETSGFSPQTDIVLSIAAASVNLQNNPMIENLYYRLIAHADVTCVPSYIWDLTGLSPQALQSGSDWQDVLFHVLQLAAQRVWIAHHARHELAFIQRYTKEFWKLRIQPIVIDTALVAQALLQTSQPPLLEHVCQWLDISLSTRHQAEEDVRMTALVWQKEAVLCRELGLNSVGEVIEWVRLRASG